MLILIAKYGIGIQIRILCISSTSFETVKNQLYDIYC